MSQWVKSTGDPNLIPQKSRGGKTSTRWFFDLYTCTMACTNTHARINKCKEINLKYSIKLGPTGWPDLPIIPALRESGAEASKPSPQC